MYHLYPYQSLHLFFIFMLDNSNIWMIQSIFLVFWGLSWLQFHCICLTFSPSRFPSCHGTSSKISFCCLSGDEGCKKEVEKAPPAWTAFKWVTHFTVIWMWLLWQAIAEITDYVHLVPPYRWAMSVSPQPIVLIRVTVSILYSYSILQNLRTILNIVLKDRLTFSLNPQGTSEAFVGSSVNFFFLSLFAFCSFACCFSCSCGCQRTAQRERERKIRRQKVSFAWCALWSNSLTRFPLTAQ